MSFLLHDPVTPCPKCYASYALLPAYLDAKQDLNKVPIKAIRSCPFVYEAELVIPEELYSLVWTQLEKKLPELEYARVVMPLSALLDGRFFNEFIKIGNIIMLSEGRAGIDNTYSLRDGVLRLDLDKFTYERVGLVGKPIRGGGRKHAKERYLIELNLRLPSMLHGKKGFERIVWAFKNVLTELVTFLFCDLSGTEELQPGKNEEKSASPLAAYSPIYKPLTTETTRIENVLTPPLTFTHNVEFQQQQGQEEQKPSTRSLTTTLEDLTDFVPEWLSLISLDSERVLKYDNIDPYLSRYRVPRRSEYGHDFTIGDDDNDDVSSNLMRIRWNGFININWMIRVLVATLSISRNATTVLEGKDWFALTARALGKVAVDGVDGYVIFCLPRDADKEMHPSRNGEGGEESLEVAAGEEAKSFSRCITWEYVSSSAAGGI